MEQNKLLLILGNQLFPINEIRKTDCKTIVMKEDLGLATDYFHHKLKIHMFFVAMREYRDELINEGFRVIYHSIDDDTFTVPFLDVLDQELQNNKISQIHYFEIIDKTFESKFDVFKQSLPIEFIEHTSPMFLFNKEWFKDFSKKKVLRMGSFYKSARIELKILIDLDNKPTGGKWSFDEDNRKKLPKNMIIPPLPKLSVSKYSKNLTAKIETVFQDHPGSVKNLWMPTNRKNALIWMDDFFDKRFENFGKYEDAVKNDNNFVFHSALSAILNLGILTPKEVINKALTYAEKHKIPINSLEGFVRQIIGWREFIRGVYYSKSEEQEKANFFGHNRKLSNHWYDGTTGIDPLDDAIKDCINYAFTHHIPRLMIIANIMNLARIHPKEIYKWFMEMFVDSSEWVMVPNIFGMGTFADGGIFATKPYACGSNYILKMSNYKKADWCDTVDGLYWKFMSDNKEFFKKNHRLSILTKALDRMPQERRNMLFLKSDKFISEKTL